MSVHLDVLRRPYTRTVAKELRPVRTLAASFADVKQQWRELLLEHRNADRTKGDVQAGRQQQRQQLATEEKTKVQDSSCSGSDLLIGARQALVAAERLTSQLKAVKQELIVHLGHARRDAEQSRAVARKEMVNPAAAGEVSDVSVSFFEELSSSFPSAGDRDIHAADWRQGAGMGSDVAPKEEPTTTDNLHTLARAVWLWSMLLGCTIADWDLLSGSLAVAHHELYGMRELRLDSLTGTGPQNELNAFFHCHLSQLQELSVPCGSSTTHLPYIASLDALFVFACARVYNVMTHDEPAAARVEQQWGNFSDSLNALVKTAKGSDAVAGAGAEGLFVREESFSLLLALDRCVSGLTAHLAAEDYGGASAVLQSCADWFCSQAGETTPSVEATEGQECAVLSRILEGGRSFFLGLQLLLRMLLELNSRRTLLRDGVGRSYRPILAAAEDEVGITSGAAASSTSADGATRSGISVFLVPCVCQRAAAVHECASCRCPDPPPSTAPESDPCLGHWPRRIQLQRLQDMGGPWPLPEAVVASQCSFLLRV